MICPNCQCNISDDSEYCVRCGKLFRTDIVDKITDKTSVDGYLGHYISEIKKGNNPRWVSFLYLLLPLNIPYLYKLPFIGINLLLFILHFMFAFRFFGDKAGVFSVPYILGSLAMVVVYYIYNIFKFNNERVNNATIRIMRIQRDNSDKTEEEIEKLCIIDGKGDTKMFILSFFINIGAFLIFNLILDIICNI